jgi:hypothetical protein
MSRRMELDRDIPVIEAREREIDKQIALLQREKDELSIAKRVLARLRGGAKTVSARPEAGAPRPAGAPTNFEMAELVLADAERAGKDGLKATELVQAIAARYWPGLVGPQILPNLYGMGKRGRFRVSGGKFSRVKGKEKAA